jgi:hypothetical protein
MKEAAPRPIFRPCHQSTLDGIAVDVTEFLNKLVLAPDIEVIVASLPEWIRGPQGQPARYSLLQRLHGLSQVAMLRFVHQQVNVLGHNRVSVNAESVVLSNAFQRRDEYRASLRTQEMWTPVITTKGQEVNLPRFVKASQPPGHEEMLFP